MDTERSRSRPAPPRWAVPTFLEIRIEICAAAGGPEIARNMCGATRSRMERRPAGHTCLWLPGSPVAAILVSPILQSAYMHVQPYMCSASAHQQAAYTALTRSLRPLPRGPMPTAPYPSARHLPTADRRSFSPPRAECGAARSRARAAKHGEVREACWRGARKCSAQNFSKISRNLRPGT